MSTILFLGFIVIIVLGAPIAIALGASSMIAIYMGTNLPLLLVPQRMYAAADSFPLMAIPFFMLAGALMEYGGIQGG